MNNVKIFVSNMNIIMNQIYKLVKNGNVLTPRMNVNILMRILMNLL